MLHHDSSGAPCALISNIQRYTVHDGPGIRTELFFTGCTLRCLWCSNPETLEPRARLGVYPNKCIGPDKCGECLKSCPDNGAPLEFDNGVVKAVRMRDACPGCFRCAEACPPRALRRWGDLMTADGLMTAILEDKSFYDRTGGGVTLSGGEVMLQWEIAAMLLEACSKAGLNTCVESALHCPRAHMESVYAHADLVIADIKHMDTKKHNEYCGAGNELILSNLKRTVELGKKLVIRTPVIPGYTGGEADIRAVGAFIRDELGNKIVQYQLLPYRKLGLEKYEALGLPYPMGAYNPPDRGGRDAEILRLADMLRNDYGVPAAAGAGGKLNL